MELSETPGWIAIVEAEDTGILVMMSGGKVLACFSTGDDLSEWIRDRFRRDPPEMQGSGQPASEEPERFPAVIERASLFRRRR